MFKVIIGILCGLGIFLILLDLYGIPYMKTSKAIESLAKKQKEKTSGLDVVLGNLASWIAARIRINDFKRTQLEADLITAQMDITPEMHTANAIVKALIIGVFAIPVYFVMPLLCPVILFLAVFLYRRELKSVGFRIKEKRSKLEFELPRLVFTIEKTLRHNRDVLYMLESYMKSAGKEMQHEPQ